MLVAVIDSGVDATHPELAGAVAQTYDTLATPMTPHKHGTAIAGLIAAHGKLMGAAPRRAFWRSAPSTARAQAPKAPPSIFSKASTGRRRTARASSI